MKVLVIDADRRFAEQVAGHMEARAHIVVHQPDPAEAMTRVKSWQPDLVFVSADAVGSGILGRLMVGKDRPAIILTGMLDQYSSVWKAWQTGGDDVLIKPVMNGDELNLAVITAMENAVTGMRTVNRRRKAS